MSTGSKEKGRLFVISGPSGAGKGTVTNRVLQLCPELMLSVSMTTRPPRAGETDGVSYYFVSREHFNGIIEADGFLEYAEYVGELYGTPAEPIRRYTEDGRDVILEIDVQGAVNVMSLVPGAVTVFIVPPDMRELERRLRGRGTDSEEKLAARLETARVEMEKKDLYAHVVINDDIDRAAEEISVIVRQYNARAGKVNLPCANVSLPADSCRNRET